MSFDENHLQDSSSPAAPQNENTRRKKPPSPLRRRGDKRHFPAEAGFTLIEILVAILVVAIAVPSVMIAFSALKGSVAPEYVIEAAELGQLQMEAIAAKTRTQIPAAGTYTCATFQATVTEVQCAVAGFAAYSYGWVVADVTATDPDTSSPGATFAKKVTLTVSRANMSPINFYSLFATD